MITDKEDTCINKHVNTKITIQGILVIFKRRSVCIMLHVKEGHVKR